MFLKKKPKTKNQQQTKPRNKNKKKTQQKTNLQHKCKTQILHNSLLWWSVNHKCHKEFVRIFFFFLRQGGGVGGGGGGGVKSKNNICRDLHVFVVTIG